MLISTNRMARFPGNFSFPSLDSESMGTFKVMQNEFISHVKACATH